jgi:hypothetical protein
MLESEYERPWWHFVSASTSAARHRPPSSTSAYMNIHAIYSAANKIMESRQRLQASPMLVSLASATSNTTTNTPHHAAQRLQTQSAACMADTQPQQLLQQLCHVAANCAAPVLPAQGRKCRLRPSRQALSCAGRCVAAIRTAHLQALHTVRHWRMPNRGP